MLGVGGAENDVRPLRRQKRHRLEPAEAGHLDVEQENVDAAGADSPEHFFTVAAFSAQLDVREDPEQAGDTLARDVLVVGNEHPESLHQTATPGSGPCIGSSSSTQVRW